MEYIMADGGGGALIREVLAGSPADDAGFTPGCRVLAVEGQPLRDVIDWRWHSAGETVLLSYLDTDGDRGEVTLEREQGEDWGFVFEGEIFDSIKTCKNACTFCFMRQLPQGMRPSLTLRDDDFRLSFLQGTFATFTNLSPEDEARIIEQRISPLRMSLHASSPQVRHALIGHHQARGIQAAERLMEAGIVLHAQIVLVPGVNDAEELARTLEWAYRRPGVAEVGVVPLGFTKHQNVFSESFNDPADARKVLEALAPFQQRAQEERGCPWVFAADELYLNAYPHDALANIPPAEHYGEFTMFEDGIGIVRSTIDSWHEGAKAQLALAARLLEACRQAHLVIGFAQRAFLLPLIEASPLAGLLVPLAVENRFFGGNVDVTGLLCGCDIVDAVNQAFPPRQGWKADTRPAHDAAHAPLVLIPRVVFNADGLTLDDMTLEDMQRRTQAPLAVVSCNPADYLGEIARLLA
ncbi:MAG: DUF512 domain-containing protein [Coriobacteriaceae bacterium]|nr:DUF512 domain-containing protein [Coriobacteriaceae bacterium]